MKMRSFNRIDFHDADALLQNILVNKIEELKQTVNRNDFSELDAVFNAIKEEQDAVCCEGHVHHG